MDISERAAMLREVRVVDNGLVLGGFELRDDGNDGLTFDGIAAVVDKPYTVRDAFGEYEETMVKGAFTKSLRDRADVALMVNHEGLALARTKSGTLKLSANPDLRAIATLDPSNPVVQTLRSAMDRGDTDAMSIGFRAVRQEWSDDYTERRITEAQLFDVSLVQFPANVHTSASLRSLIDTMREFTAGDVDADDVRRAIDYLASLLPEDDVCKVYVDGRLIATVEARAFTVQETNLCPTNRPYGVFENDTLSRCYGTESVAQYWADAMNNAALGAPIDTSQDRAAVHADLVAAMETAARRARPETVLPV